MLIVLHKPNDYLSYETIIFPKSSMVYLILELSFRTGIGKTLFTQSILLFFNIICH
jgi:hypothetical protein